MKVINSYKFFNVSQYKTVGILCRKITFILILLRENAPFALQSSQALVHSAVEVVVILYYCRAQWWSSGSPAF